MSVYQAVAKTGDIPRGTGRAFAINGKLVAIFNVDGEFLAIDDACPHMGASLAEGFLEGDAVSCPWHGWRFCVRDGLWIDNRRSALRTGTYAVRVEGGVIEVSVPERPAEAEPPSAAGEELGKHYEV
jgi:nitrite reductase (NADH) small subunit/3-phenylpropionate/trans-cinnamate dioxygenase ferredoxin subunit